MMDSHELIDNNSHYEPMAQGGVGDPESGYWETTGPAFDGSTPQWIDTRPIHQTGPHQQKTSKKEQRERTPEEQQRINERMRLLRERKRRKREEAAHAGDFGDTKQSSGVSKDVAQLPIDKRDQYFGGDDRRHHTSIPQKAPRHLAARFIDARGGVDNELHLDKAIITETHSSPSIDRKIHTEGHGDRFISPGDNIANKTLHNTELGTRTVIEPKREKREEGRNVRRTRAEIDEGVDTYAQDVADYGHGSIPHFKRDSLSLPPFDGESSRFEPVRDVLPRDDSHVQHRRPREPTVANGVGSTDGPSFSSISSLILPIIKIGAICFAGYIAFNQLGGDGTESDDDKSAPFPPPNMEIEPDREEQDTHTPPPPVPQQKPIQFASPSPSTTPALTKMDVNKTPTPSKLQKTVPATLFLKT